MVVVEAAEQPGPLISAPMAGKQGRQVMAVPGSPLDPRAAATDGLSRQGAARVRGAGNVLEVLTGLPPLYVAAPPPPACLPDAAQGPRGDDQMARVRKAMSSNPMPIDGHPRAAGLAAARSNAVLLELGIAGEAVSYPGQPVARAV